MTPLSKQELRKQIADLLTKLSADVGEEYHKLHTGDQDFNLTDGRMRYYENKATDKLLALLAAYSKQREVEALEPLQRIANYATEKEGEDLENSLIILAAAIDRQIVTLSAPSEEARNQDRVTAMASSDSKMTGASSNPASTGLDPATEAAVDKLIDEPMSFIEAQTGDENVRADFKAALTRLLLLQRQEARLIELDLLEQAINQGRDMNKYKLQRLASLETQLEKEGQGDN